MRGGGNFRHVAAGASEIGSSGNPASPAGLELVFLTNGDRDRFSCSRHRLTNPSEIGSDNERILFFKSDKKRVVTLSTQACV